MIGEFTVSQSQLTLRLAPGIHADDSSTLTRVHIRSNADLGFRLRLISGSSSNADSAVDRRADSRHAPRMSVRTWQEGTETEQHAETLTLKPGGVVLRDTHSALSMSEPIDLVVEFTVQNDFSTNAGEYRQDYQLVFEPRYSRAPARD
jgi:hypothetical protein